MALMAKFTDRLGATLPTTPWAARSAEDDGLYFGRNRQVAWLYRQFPLAALQWEDTYRRLELGAELDAVLVEIGALSKDYGQGIRALSRNRKIHLLAVTYHQPTELPPGTPETLHPFMNEVLYGSSPAKALLLGVRLESDALVRAAQTRGGATKKLKAALDGATGDDETSTMARLRNDYTAIKKIFDKAGLATPSPPVLNQAEAWFNKGRGADASILYAADSFRVTGGEEYQIAAVREFEQPQMPSTSSLWILDAMTHPEPAVAVSVRAELEPAKVTRPRLRRRRRGLLEQQREEARTGDVGRDENAENMALATSLETYVRQSGTPWLTNATILFASRVTSADRTYSDDLRDRYAISTRVLNNHRQTAALSEMLPCSEQVASPFPQDLNPEMIAYSGIAGFSALGDKRGVFVGYVDPDYSPMYLDPEASSRENKPPVMGLFGDPGSGKTFVAQLIAGQNAIAGGTSVFVNPKSADTLTPWAEWCRSMGAKVETVTLSEGLSLGGAFDPFRFAEPGYAAEILSRHITTTLFGVFSAEQELLLQDGLKQGAEAGARCADQALDYVENAEVKRLVRLKARSSDLFAVGYGTTPKQMWDQQGGLTLIEFGRDLPLPSPGSPPEYYEAQEREALAAMRLVTRAAIEILIRAGGGTLVVDEAHHFLGSEEGLKSLDRLAREGRSMGLLPIFATQRVTDLLDADMETFMSRVLAMKLNDQTEADAALQLARLKPTQVRRDFLRGAGPRQEVEGQSGRPAMGLFRDLQDRHAVVSVGPIPEHVRLAMSTNRTDREKRDKET